jgi:hypothetical protein
MDVELDAVQQLKQLLLFQTFVLVVAVGLASMLANNHTGLVS